MATETKIEVVKEDVTVYDNTPGRAGRIAVIGAFDSEVTDVTSVSTASAAHTIFGTTGTVDAFKGTDMIDFLFIGASSLLVVNTTTWSDATPPVASTTMTNEKLTAALAKLKEESFDMLVIADQLSDAAQTIVTTWVNNEFKGKFAHGQVAQLQKSSTSAYETSVATFGDEIYWICTQQYTYNGTTLSLNQSAALMAGYIASLEVNKSLTHKVIPGISAVSPEYTFESGDIGAKLLDLSVPILKPRNRTDGTCICINSELPNGLDLYINRVRDYVINRLEAETLLGELSVDETIETAEMIAENVRYECVEQLKLLKNIIYSIVKTDANKIEIRLEKLIFDGVITEIKIPYSIKVE